MPPAKDSMSPQSEYLHPDMRMLVDVEVKDCWGTDGVGGLPPIKPSANEEKKRTLIEMKVTLRRNLSAVKVSWYGAREK